MDFQELLQISNDEVLSELQTISTGLTNDEANTRLGIYGFNEIIKEKRRGILVEFLDHFKNPLVIILLIASFISIFLQEVVNALIIFFIVIMSVVLDFLQTHKAERAAEQLKEKITTTATVVRGGRKQEVKLSLIVPGDIINLTAGDIVPADARVLSAKDFFVNQSALTGEPYPVEKTSIPISKRTVAIGEWSNYIFLGTSVVSGTATAVVMKTGASTEYGKIAKTLMVRPPETEFERGLRGFGYLMMKIVFLLVIFVFLINALFKHGILESLLFAVALAVGLTPELLPMILSINLSKGAISMSHKGVIVKHLESIQNFGSMDVLCTDKTGTLTENKITLILHVDAEGKDSEKVFLFSYLNSFHQTGLKSPLDEAIIRYREEDLKDYQKIDELPFDFTRRRVSVVVTDGQERLLIAKGAPEGIIEVCCSCETSTGTIEITENIQKRIIEKYYDMSRDGYRVLGVAYKPLRDGPVSYSVNEENDMVFLGFVAFIDPPKETARDSLQLVKNTGIALKILTGDNELVTAKTCSLLDYDIAGIVTGNDIAQMDDDALQRVVEKANIFTRVNPVQKDRIIIALKKNGHVVGFLGDGINDAPSLKTADIGISVENAVDIARESADIILLKKDLSVLEEGVMEGRKTFGNTMKYIMMGTSSNFGNMFSVAGASLFLPFLPMLPIQILLNNLLYDTSESTIPTDSVDREYIVEPKRWDIGFIKKFIIIFGPVSSIFDFLTFFILLIIFHATESLFQTAWFIESLCTQTMIIFVIRTRIIPFYKSKPSWPVLTSSLAIVGAACVIPWTILGPIFGFTQPPLVFYVILGGLIAGYLLLVEIVKKWFYHQYFQIRRLNSSLK